MSKLDLGFAFGLPPEQALEYFRSKGYVLSMDWREVWQGAHDRAFTVAHVMKTDILQDIRAGVDQFIEGGVTRRQVMQSMQETLVKKGWWSDSGRGLVVDDDGGVLGKKLNARRLTTILHTNSIQSYNAAQYKRAMALSNLKPYWRYDHHVHKFPRKHHQALDGLIFIYSDPFWLTHTPQNGWGCNCGITVYSMRDLEREGLLGNLREGEGNLKTWVQETKRRDGSIDKQRVTTYTDPKRLDANGKPVSSTPDVGFNYSVGRNAMQPFTAPPLDSLPRTFSNGRVLGERPPLPTPTKVSTDDVLAKGLTEEAYAQAFLSEFGATLDNGVVFKDVTGTALPINQALFIDKRTGDLKADKQGRGVFLKQLAQTVKNPDEVWLNWQEVNGEYLLKRRYIKAYEYLQDGKVMFGLGVFELGQDGWTGSTVFPSKLDRSYASQLKYINEQREGLMLYRVKDGQ